HALPPPRSRRGPDRRARSRRAVDPGRGRTRRVVGRRLLRPVPRQERAPARARGALLPRGDCAPRSAVGRAALGRRDRARHRRRCRRRACHRHRGAPRAHPHLPLPRDPGHGDPRPGDRLPPPRRRADGRRPPREGERRPTPRARARARPCSAGRVLAHAEPRRPRRHSRRRQDAHHRRAEARDRAPRPRLRRPRGRDVGRARAGSARGSGGGRRTARAEARVTQRSPEDPMDYTQRNPLPMPPSGAFESVRATIDTVFDWQYELRKKNLLALYEKGKTLTWNANDLDWSIDVDAERLMGERIANGAADLMNTLMSPPIPLAPDELMRMQLNMNAFMLSQFLHGEQGALVATAKIVQGVPWEEAKFYAANQVADEARHVEVYHRYLTEKLG